MFGYIVRRLFQGVLVLFLISNATFALFFYGPSDPAKAMCPESRCTPARFFLAPGSGRRSRSGEEYRGRRRYYRAFATNRALF